MARILYHETVVRDGHHNAFTDLIHWQGQHWITYRKGQSHHLLTGEICVAVSGDRRRWREVAHLKTAGDDRDPRFAIAPDGRLALLFPVCNDATGDISAQQYISFSANGHDWETPRPILAPRHHIFRGRWHEGLYYGLDIVRNPEERHLEISTSRDLLHWEPHCNVGTSEQALNESDIAFLSNGEVWIIARTTRKPDDTFFCRAKPPYTNWELTDLKMMVHCPAILQDGDALYLAGRNNPKREGDSAWPFGNSLAIWKLEAARLTKLLQIPAIGDCAYPGFIKDPDGRFCLSYYSQHAYYMGVHPPWTGRIPGTETEEKHKQGFAADIYFAELELP